jgi:nitrite reductase/ring-hydroxylating ferredoxin subunit
VCKTSELNDGQLLSFDYDGKKIMLAKMQGKIFATDRTCTHEEADLSTGILTEQGVTCPLHLSVFNLENGNPENLPAEKSLETFNIKTNENEIYVEVP